MNGYRLYQRASRGLPVRQRGGLRHLRGPAGGFSLLELIGVLSVMAILTSLVAPAAFRQLRHAEQRAESQTIAAMGRAIEEAILDRKLLPGTNDWPLLVARYVDQSAQGLGTTRSGAPRYLIYHPASAIRPQGEARVQTASGFQNLAPGTDRMLLVSILEDRFPAGVNLGLTATFEALWNTLPHQRPAGWTAAMLPDPDDLQIARIDLSRLLHRVVINNTAIDNTSARISLDVNQTLVSIPRTGAASAWERSFIHGTGLSLYSPQGTLWGREMIVEDRTLYYGETGWWLRTHLNPPRPGTSSSTVATLVQDFLNANFAGACNQQRPRAAVDELYRSLWTYMDWAEAGFLLGGNNKKQAPDVYVVRSTVARLNQGTLNLIGSGGGGK